MTHGHGDDAYRYGGAIKINFSSNVYCPTPNQPLLRHLANQMEQLKTYPEPEPTTLESTFADVFHLQPSEVCITNGATEAIYLIAQTFRGRRSSILMPTFSEYAAACRLHQHQVSGIFSLDTLGNTDIVWLCNPNNPTGEVCQKATLLHHIATHRSTLFVIDQSYESFTLEPLLSAAEAAALPNVILIHSLTKHYAIPGLRLGYITANSELLSRIRLQRMPWSVNALAIEAGHFVARQALHPLVDIEALLVQKQQLVIKLQQLGFVDVWHSDTHFFLCQMRYGTSSALKHYLATTHGILIRDAQNFEGLNNTYFRLATQSEDHNETLIQALEKWLTL